MRAAAVSSRRRGGGERTVTQSLGYSVTRRRGRPSARRARAAWFAHAVLFRASHTKVWFSLHVVVMLIEGLAASLKPAASLRFESIQAE